ncbi:MAG TPA: 2OG-Fe(II) oxygenase [Caulobacteraceae bacterium]|nr:2OG-Fe(II) oxygenase [Caulobacteraceae bacterium]
MSYLDIKALDAAPLIGEPFEYVIVEGFVPQGFAAEIGADYPAIDKPGSFTLDDVPVRGAFEALIAEMSGETFCKAVEAKFGLSLADKATTFTVRGQSGDKDGYIHTDSKTKVITVLLYLNEAWAPDGGRLRLLRGPDDLEDFVVEAPPNFGSLLIFRRSDRSWHGHKPFIGPRRVVQMNWVTSSGVARWQLFRHRVSAVVKRLAPAKAGVA